jgi:hypothetical protein
MIVGLICSAVIAIVVLLMLAGKRKPTPTKTVQPVRFEEALIDFTPKKGYLPFFEKNQRLS